VRAGEILTVVEAEVRRTHEGAPTVYRREWSIGVGETRVDLAAINGQILGCEIKSARDNFGRLASQVRTYSKVLDLAIIVVEGRAAAARVEDLVPVWWGIWRAMETPRGAALEIIRCSELNPAPDPLAVAQLLWRDEAFGLAERAGLSRGLRKATRWRLWETLAANIPLSALQQEVREVIKARQEW
jgi:hypothetical protein